MDKKQIVGLVKDEGLDLAEDMAIAGVRGALKIIRVIVPQLSRGAGTMVNLFFDAYEDEIIKLLDKIDGKADIEI